MMKSHIFFDTLIKYIFYVMEHLYNIFYIIKRENILVDDEKSYILITHPYQIIYFTCWSISTTNLFLHSFTTFVFSSDMT